MASPKPLAGLTNIAPYVGGESEITGFDRESSIATQMATATKYVICWQIKIICRKKTSSAVQALTN